jgi:osmotically-inducible protein OsmY
MGTSRSTILHIAFAAALGLAAVSAHADIYAPAEAPAAERSIGTLEGDTAFSYSTADTTDRAVAERVMDALAEDPALHGSAITVLVDEGHVRLSGATRDEEQAAHALEVARDAAGPNVIVTAGSLEPDGSAAAIR